MVENPAANTGDTRNVVQSLGGEDPRCRKWQPTPVFWKIPWAEDPDGLQFMGSQRVGHN